MLAWIAKIEAESAPLPGDTALDGDALRAQMFDSSYFVFACNRERQVRGPFAIVRRDMPPGVAIGSVVACLTKSRSTCRLETLSAQKRSSAISALKPKMR